MISEEDFAFQIQDISMKDHEWVTKESSTGSKYLVKPKHKVSHEDEIYNFEYHIVRHPSYCVPVLCFHVCSSEGKIITEYECIFAIFKAHLPKGCLESTDLYAAVTQIDHPVLQIPIWALHPCKTPALLENFAENSTNLVLTFLSTFGPFVGLSVDHLMT